MRKVEERQSMRRISSGWMSYDSNAFFPDKVICIKFLNKNEIIVTHRMSFASNYCYFHHYSNDSIHTPQRLLCGRRQKRCIVGEK